MEMTFEEAIKRLEEIVATLESQNPTLEESVNLYKEGAALGKLCRQILMAAEHEIKMWGEEEDSSALEEPEI